MVNNVLKIELGEDEAILLLTNTLKILSYVNYSEA